MTDNRASEAVLRKAGLRWQSVLPVEIPVRSGTFLTSFGASLVRSSKAYDAHLHAFRAHKIAEIIFSD
jgi:hypothetical protein